MSAADAGAGPRALSRAGRELGVVRDDAGAAVAAAAAARPWGDDEVGRAFESRFRPLETQVLTAWEQLAQYVESLGEAAGRAVRDQP